jgi:hypothetical protein
MVGDLARDGWVLFDADPRVAAWTAAAAPVARAIAADPGQRARWLRHGGTWFVGVDVLPNGPDGAMGGVPLAGPWQGLVSDLPLHPAQVSVIYPGYPGRDPADTGAAHRFRVTRDAAHLDGLLAEGADKRRHLREPHAWVLGLPLTDCSADASPLVVWEGSHHLVQAAFAKVFAGLAPEVCGDLDVTDIYQATRAQVFATCARRPLPVRPGQAVLLHRHLIHGVAPWAPGATAPAEGRMMAYFRPQFSAPADWLAP